MADPTDAERAKGINILRGEMYGTVAGENGPDIPNMNGAMYNTQRAAEGIREYKSTDDLPSNEKQEPVAEHPILQHISNALEKQKKNLEMMQLLHTFLQKMHKLNAGDSQ